MDEVTIGAKVREAREASRLGQTELARALRAKGFSFHQQTVQRVESGERPLRHSEALALADLIGFRATSDVSAECLELVAFRRRVLEAVEAKPGVPA